MKRNIRSLILITLLCSCPLVHGAAQEPLFSVVAKANLTTAARLFLNPNASDAYARAQSVSFTDFFGYGAEIRYHIPGTTLAVGLSADYIVSSDTRSIAGTAQRSVPVEDGYRVIPVNPQYDEILGEKSYKSLSDIPDYVDVVNIFMRTENVIPVVEEAVIRKPKAIWLQLGIVNDEAREIAKKNGIDFVQDLCIKVEHARLL